VLVCVYSAVNGIKTTKLLLTNTTGIDRGEGFNHAILDDWGLTAAVQRIYDTLHAEDAAAATEVRDAAIAEFQADVRRREVTLCTCAERLVLKCINGRR